MPIFLDPFHDHRLKTILSLFFYWKGIKVVKQLNNLVGPTITSLIVSNPEVTSYFTNVDGL